jgi:phage terminase large subunit
MSVQIDWLAPDYNAIWADRVAKLKALRANPERLPGVQAHYKDNPVDFINDWGCTFDPRNANSNRPTTMPFILFAKQEEFIDWVAKLWKKREDGAVEKSRDMGLSWLCVAVAAWMWIYHPGSVIGFGSRKEDLVDKSDDPQCLFWKLRFFIRMLPHEFKPAGYAEERHAAHMRIVNPDPRMEGAAIIGESGGNIGRGGRTTIYFKDESAHWDHPESADMALSQTSNVKIDISTPNGEGNPFWAKVHGGVIKVFVFDWRDDPRKGKDWYAKQKRGMTAVALAQEVDRDYSASVMNSYISSGIVTLAQSRGPADVRPIGRIRVGLDVARFGNDKCVLSFRRGRVLLGQIKWGKSDVASTAGRAKQEILKFGEMPEQIAIDTIGIGAGVADIMRGWYPKGIVVDVNSAIRLDNGKHYNLRAFIWSEMLEWLKTASIPNEQELRVALTGTRYFYKGGLLLMEPKDDMKLRGLPSPDEADSLGLTLAIPPKPQPVRPAPDKIAAYSVDDEMGM